MARILTRQGRQTLPGVPSPRIPAATGIGEGLQQLGAAVTKVADDALEREAVLAAEKAAAETRDEFSRRSLAMEQDAPLGAPGHEDALLAAYDEAAASRLEAAPPRARDRLKIWLDDERVRIADRARRFEAASRLDKNRQDTLDVVELNANAVRTDAAHFERALQASEAAIAVSGLDAPSRAALQRNAEARIASALIQGLNETDPERAKRLLESRELDAYLTPEAKNVLVNDNAVELRRREAARGALVTEAKAEIREVVKLLEDGFDPGAERLTRLATVARGDDAIAEDLADALEIYEVVRTARGMTPADLQNFVNEMESDLAEKKGVTEAERSTLIAVRSLHNTMVTEIARDPLSWAARAGTHQVEPLSLAGEDAGESIRQRIRDARQVAVYYGARPRYLTDEEATQLAGIADGPDLDAQLALSATIVDGFGAAAPAVLREIKAKGPDLFGHAGGLALAGDTRAARDVLAGAALLSDKAAELPPKLDRNAAREEARGAFRLAPAVGGVHARATEAIYAARAARRGLDSESLDEDLWEEAQQLAAGAVYRADGTRMGGIVDYNGRPVVVPADIAADQFEDLVGEITDADLAGAAWLGGEPVKAEDLHDGDLWLVSDGPGRYRIAATDPAEGDVEYAGEAGGTAPYILDLSRDGALLPFLRVRLGGVGAIPAPEAEDLP